MTFFFPLALVQSTTLVIQVDFMFRSWCHGGRPHLRFCVVCEMFLQQNLILPLAGTTSFSLG